MVSWVVGGLHGCRTSSFSQQPTLPIAWSSSVSFRKLNINSAPRLCMEVRASITKSSPSGCLKLPPFLPEVMLRRTGRAWVQCPVLSSFPTHRDLMLGQGRSLVRVSPACLDVVLPRLLGTVSYTACFFTHCVSSSRAFRTKIGSNVLSLSDRIQLLHNLSTLTFPTAPLQ